MHFVYTIFNCVIKFYSNRFTMHFISHPSEKRLNVKKISQMFEKPKTPGKQKIWYFLSREKLRKFIRPWHSESFLLTAKSIFVLQFLSGENVFIMTMSRRIGEGKFCCYTNVTRFYMRTYPKHHYIQTCAELSGDLLMSRDNFFSSDFRSFFFF